MNASSTYTLVPNAPEYYEFIRCLRNDDVVQNGFLQRVSVSPEQQATYMDKHSASYYVCLVGGQPAGYIGEIDGDIRVATHPAFQRKGVGLFMVKRFLEARPNCVARVKVDNTASLELFRKAGFVEKLIVFEPPGG